MSLSIDQLNRQATIILRNLDRLQNPDLCTEITALGDKEVPFDFIESFAAAQTYFETHGLYPDPEYLSGIADLARDWSDGTLQYSRAMEREFLHEVRLVAAQSAATSALFQADFDGAREILNDLHERSQRTEDNYTLRSFQPPIPDPEILPVIWSEALASEAAAELSPVISHGEISILSGAGGGGKSTLCAQIALAAASITAEEDTQKTAGLVIQRGPVVLVISLEDRFRRIFDRLQSISAGVDFSSDLSPNPRTPP